jgi:hypothetical protein
MRGAALVGLLVATACGPRSPAEAEARRDVAWLTENASADSVAALGRLADNEPRALAALEARADHDQNVHIAAFTAVTRSAPWGTHLLRASLADPVRAELAAAALPRKDPRIATFAPDLEGAVSRLAAGRGASLVAGILAGLGPPAHAHVERRLLDPRTRGPMCDGIAMPEASPDARALLLSVGPDARDHASCVAAVIELAIADDAVVSWIATTAEPGLLGAAARSNLPCPRVAAMWKKALTERAAESHAALTVPLERTITRCGPYVDPILGEVMARAPGARPAILRAIDPYGSELAELPATCAALRAGHARGETPPLRERAQLAVERGCALGR